MAGGGIACRRGFFCHAASVSSDSTATGVPLCLPQLSSTVIMLKSFSVFEFSVKRFTSALLLKNKINIFNVLLTALPMFVFSACTSYEGENEVVSHGGKYGTRAQIEELDSGRFLLNMEIENLNAKSTKECISKGIGLSEIPINSEVDLWLPVVILGKSIEEKDGRGVFAIVGSTGPVLHGLPREGRVRFSVPLESFFSLAYPNRTLLEALASEDGFVKGRLALQGPSGEILSDCEMHEFVINIDSRSARKSLQLKGQNHKSLGKRNARVLDGEKSWNGLSLYSKRKNDSEIEIELKNHSNDKSKIPVVRYHSKERLVGKTYSGIDGTVVLCLAVRSDSGALTDEARFIASRPNSDGGSLEQVLELGSYKSLIANYSVEDFGRYDYSGDGPRWISLKDRLNSMEKGNVWFRVQIVISKFKAIDGNKNVINVTGYLSSDWQRWK